MATDDSQYISYIESTDGVGHPLSAKRLDGYYAGYGASYPEGGRNSARGHLYSYLTNASVPVGSEGDGQTTRPTTYTATIGFGAMTVGQAELMVEWTNPSSHGMWHRSLRDTENDWSDWIRVGDDKYHPITCSSISDLPAISVNKTSNSIVQRDSNGYIACGYIHTDNGNENSAWSDSYQLYYCNGDGWLRKMSVSQWVAQLNNYYKQYVILPNTTSSWTWGTLTTSNGYTQLGDYDESGGGSFAVAAKGGKISVQIDGKFYDNEGQSKVLSTQDVTYDSSTGVMTISL